MRNFTEQSITQAGLERFGPDCDPRLREVMTSFIRHLHDFVRETRITPDEWLKGIQFLTECGKFCDDKRQEFILLSDTLGVSMLVDAINHRSAEASTETTVLGPFFVQDAPECDSGADISGAIEGEPLLISGSVCGGDGRPLAGAIVDIWHSDSDGYYDVQQLDAIGDLAMRGRFRTGADGRFHCWSIKPAAYPVPHDGPVGQMLQAQGRHPWRPAHVHFMISAPRHEKLVTHIFASGDQYLDSDVVFGVKDSLIGVFVAKPPGAASDGRIMARPYCHLHHDFRLRPDPACIVSPADAMPA
jgi:hydroxyquinol 1,2-dioxygenase